MHKKDSEVLHTANGWADEENTNHAHDSAKEGYRRNTTQPLAQRDARHEGREEESKKMKRLPTTCPSCGSANVKRIVYGYPFDPPAGETELLGGCVFREDDPDWQCSDCQAEGNLGLTLIEKATLPKKKGGKR
ncbi:MAG: hypothetical protein U0Y68_09965 [Blastocatellia bacterium]